MYRYRIPYRYLADPGIGAFLIPAYGSGIRIRDQGWKKIFQNLVSVFGIKILKFRILSTLDPRSGMEKFG
jgi:hypothetical protein